MIDGGGPTVRSAPVDTPASDADTQRQTLNALTTAHMHLELARRHLQHGAVDVAWLDSRLVTTLGLLKRLAELQADPPAWTRAQRPPPPES
jgi:hypothetical protein